MHTYILVQQHTSHVCMSTTTHTSQVTPNQIEENDEIQESCQHGCPRCPPIVIHIGGKGDREPSPIQEKGSWTGGYEYDGVGQSDRMARRRKKGRRKQLQTIRRQDAGYLQPRRPATEYTISTPSSGSKKSSFNSMGEICANCRGPVEVQGGGDQEWQHSFTVQQHLPGGDRPEMNLPVVATEKVSDVESVDSGVKCGKCKASSAALTRIFKFSIGIATLVLSVMATNNATQ